MSFWDAIFGATPSYADCKPHTTVYEWQQGAQFAAEQFDKECMKKALELCKECDPAYNIMPLLRLVQEARLLGYDVCKRAIETAPPAQGEP
jgi:hypothetical protein